MDIEDSGSNKLIKCRHNKLTKYKYLFALKFSLEMRTCSELITHIFTKYNNSNKISEKNNNI